jgi:potassium-dependent mechanosensitive channel
MRAARILLSALVALCLAISAAVALDRAIIGETDRALQQLRIDLDAATLQLRRPNLSDQDLSNLKITLEKIRTTAADRSIKLVVPLGEVTQQLNSLGAAPAAGQKEDDGVAQSRSDLTNTRDKLQSLKAQLDVVTVESEQVSRSVSTMQRDQFFGRIFDRSRSILNPQLWYDLFTGIGVLFTGLGLMLRNWWSDVSQSAQPLGLLMIPLIILGCGLVFRLVNRFFARWLTGYSTSGRPIDNMTRLWIILRALIVAFAALAILFFPIRFALESSGYFNDATPRMVMLWDALRDTVFTTIFYYVLGRRVAAPGRPEIRIVDIDDTAASRFTLLVGLTAFVASFNHQLGQVSAGMFLSLNYTQGQSALGALTLLVLASLVLLVLRNQPGLPEEDKRRFYFGWAARLVPVVWVLLVIGFAALAMGYLALGDYLAHQIVRTAMVVTLVFLVYHLLDAMVQASFDPQSNFGIFLRRITGLGERAIERVGLIFRTVVDLVLVIAGIPLLLLLWTLNWVDMRGLVNTLALGITIGDVTILPGTLAIMLAILVAGVIATKLFNSWLDHRILSDTRIKKGVQDSILTGASYVGYFLAGLFALTAAGVDFSSLAIIAGALGLGIGLGLQSIINNFVSGVILLAERPIRVGDWVSLPEGEGIVRRINVRSTEIETFDSCSIILPNSALVTEAVKNWTHNDDMGRFSIDVVVDYDTDAEVMKKLLLDVTRAHPKVLKHPTPTVLLTSFGKNGLEFVVRAFVADVLLGAQVASDIRFALLSQFRDNGITIAQAVAVVQPPK